MTDALGRLCDEGVAIWLDDLSRKRITSGNLAELIDRSQVVGVTTNPSIFQKVISSGDGYEQQLGDLAARRVTVEEAVRMITTADVRDAADILRAVFDATGGQDGRVSIEVDPRLAHNTDATAAGAKQLAWLVDRPNTLIKIPATRAGLPAITETIALGISVNVTLIFSLERYRAVMDAYLAGLEKSKANKQRPLWASTGVKDPSLKDTLYVDELVAPGTVNTMPEATLEATAEHGDIHGNAVAGTYEQARADLDAVEKVGISYEEVVELLEKEGVEKFEASWNELLASTEAQLGRLAPPEV